MDILGDIVISIGLCIIIGVISLLLKIRNNTEIIKQMLNKLVDQKASGEQNILKETGKTEENTDSTENSKKV